jgi:EAL domain-containing protein (putative c-di-GMP-specific phosphodiesterase class I)
LIGSIISLATGLGLEVVAEGVETEAQADCLISAGCTYLQGFLFGRPLPPEEASAFLTSRRAA